MNKNYYLLTNLLTEEETKIITSIIQHIENDERRIGVQQIANENYVSPTYIIKMCKRLGFDGYSELYYHLQQTANAKRRVGNFVSSSSSSRTRSSLLMEVGFLNWLRTISCRGWLSAVLWCLTGSIFMTL